MCLRIGRGRASLICSSMRERLTALLVGIALGTALASGISWWRGRHRSAELRRLEHVVDSAKTARAAAIDTVTVYAPAVHRAIAESDRLTALVSVVGPSTLAVRTTPGQAPTLFPVPPEVASLILAQQRTIGELERHVARYEELAGADSLVITQQDSLIAELKKGRACGPVCGAGIALGSLGLIKLALLALF